MFTYPVYTSAHFSPSRLLFSFHSYYLFQRLFLLLPPPPSKSCKKATFHHQQAVSGPSPHRATHHLTPTQTLWPLPCQAQPSPGSPVQAPARFSEIARWPCGNTRSPLYPTKPGQVPLARLSISPRFSSSKARRISPRLLRNQESRRVSL